MADFCECLLIVDWPCDGEFSLVQCEQCWPLMHSVDPYEYCCYLVMMGSGQWAASAQCEESVL